MSVRKFYGFYLECPFKLRYLELNMSILCLFMYMYTNVEGTIPVMRRSITIQSYTISA